MSDETSIPQIQLGASQLGRGKEKLSIKGGEMQ